MSGRSLRGNGIWVRTKVEGRRHVQRPWGRIRALEDLEEGHCGLNPANKDERGQRETAGDGVRASVGGLAGWVHFIRSPVGSPREF